MDILVGKKKVKIIKIGKHWGVCFGNVGKYEYGQGINTVHCRGWLCNARLGGDL